ncbi:MAG TPA: hypothetical protein VGJ25_09150 [Gaiellaceae bacterium]
MTELRWTDPETGERKSLDLTGWRFRVQLGDKTLVDRELLPHLLQASIELELDSSPISFGPVGVAPISVAYVDGTLCVVAYTKPQPRWL